MTGDASTLWPIGCVRYARVLARVVERSVVVLPSGFPHQMLVNIGVESQFDTTCGFGGEQWDDR